MCIQSGYEPPIIWLLQIHVYTGLHRAGLLPDRDYCTGSKYKETKNSRLDGLPASIPAADLQNTKHEDHAIFGSRGIFDSYLSVIYVKL